MPPGFTFVAFFSAIFASTCTQAKCPTGTAQGLKPTECYVQQPGLLTWLQSEAECVAYGGHLASIPNATYNKLLRGLSNVNTVSSYWTGARYNSPVANKWGWTGGEAFSYNNWDTGQPASLKCALFKAATGKWGTSSCAITRPHICKVPGVSDSDTCPTCSNTGTCPTAAPAALCPSGWVYYAGTQQCYKYLSGIDTWLNYEAKCVLEGGHLASVHSWAEAKFLQEISMTGLPMPDCSTNHCLAGIWIGLSAEAGQGYKWADGTALTWQHWGPTQSSAWNQRTFVSFYPDNFSSDYHAVWDNYMWDHYPRINGPVYYVRGGICKK